MRRLWNVDFTDVVDPKACRKQQLSAAIDAVNYAIQQLEDLQEDLEERYDACCENSNRSEKDPAGKNSPRTPVRPRGPGADRRKSGSSKKRGVSVVSGVSRTRKADHLSPYDYGC